MVANFVKKYYIASAKSHVFVVIRLSVAPCVFVVVAGNFNGRRSDDVLGRDGRRYLDVEHLGASWILNAGSDRSCDAVPRSTAPKRNVPQGRRQRTSTGDDDRSPVHAQDGHGPRTTCLHSASLDDIRRGCAVLKSSPFRRCHSRVDVTHYYQ